MHGTQKSRLRSELTTARTARPAEVIERARAGVRAVVLARCAESGWRCVAAYIPLRTEPGSRELLTALTDRGVRVLVPVLLDDRDLDWADWDPTTGQPGASIGTDAIASADAILAPALAVARDGVRLGRGGGSYDRALGRAREGVPIAALLYEEELVDDLPSDAWDQRVTAAVTPAGWRDIGPG